MKYVQEINDIIEKALLNHKIEESELTPEENKKTFLSMSAVFNYSVESQLKRMMDDCKDSIDRFAIKFYEKYPQYSAFECMRCLGIMRDIGTLFIYIDADDEEKEQIESYFIDNFYDNYQGKSR